MKTFTDEIALEAFKNDLELLMQRHGVTGLTYTNDDDGIYATRADGKDSWPLGWPYASAVVPQPKKALVYIGAWAWDQLHSNKYVSTMLDTHGRATYSDGRPPVVLVQHDVVLEMPEPAFELKWKQGAYVVDKPNVGDTKCYTEDQMRAALYGKNP